LGHPWVYDNEVEKVLSGPGAKAESASLEPGEITDVESSRKTYLGRAFINPASKIIARIYSPSKEGVDKGFFKRRLREALLLRAAAFSACAPDFFRESCRIVFAEADFLPGLIIDRFVGWPLEELEAAVNLRPLVFEDAYSALGKPKSWLSVQFLCYGMDIRRDIILEALKEVLSVPLYPGKEAPGTPAGIYEKSDVKVRELEGLPLREGPVEGSCPPGGIVIFENRLPFVLHLDEGQKTGHFLDQKENRSLCAAYAEAARVLDVFSYTGGFGIHAARAGAASVSCVDLSEAALETLKMNAALNGVSEKVSAVKSDVFEYLRRAERKKEKFDLVILDPPAFAKSRKSLSDALRGYKEINLKALKLLRPGGVLVSCSCSHALDGSRFKRMIVEAAADAERRLVRLGFYSQGQDHPILAGYDESEYLKCGIYRVL
jgi:23S rRNA (cytosine1962-C5)-methyltransferase